MHKINGPGATAGNEWTEGDPSLAIPRTTATAAWYNSVQRELIALVEAAGLSPSTVDDDQVLEAIRFLSGGSGKRNKLLNGDFALEQRQGIQLAPDGYGPDRWYGNRGDSAATPLLSRASLGFGITLPTGNPSHEGLWNQLAGAGTTSTAGYMEQRIEGVHTLHSTSAVRLSYWGKVDSGTLSVTPKLVQHFDGGSSDVVLAGTPDTWTTTYQRFTHTFNVPTIDGKTIGGPDHRLAVRIEWPHVATFLARFTDVQLEQGDVASAFERLTVQEQYLACSRYYQQSMALDFDGPYPALEGQRVAAGSNLIDLSGLQARLFPMRVIPTVQWINPTDGTLDEVEWNAVGRTVSGNNNPGVQSTGYPTTTASPSGVALASAHFTADAEIY